MAASSYVPDSVKCLEGVDYNVVKVSVTRPIREKRRRAHSEWVPAVFLTRSAIGVADRRGSRCSELEMAGTD